MPAVPVVPAVAVLPAVPVVPAVAVLPAVPVVPAVAVLPALPVVPALPLVPAAPAGAWRTRASHCAGGSGSTAAGTVIAPGGGATKGQQAERPDHDAIVLHVVTSLPAAPERLTSGPVKYRVETVPYVSRLGGTTERRATANPGGRDRSNRVPC